MTRLSSSYYSSAFSWKPPLQPHITQSPAPGDPSQGGIIRGEKKEPDSLCPVPKFPSRLACRECRFMSGCFSIPFLGLISPGQRLLEESVTLSACGQMSV